MARERRAVEPRVGIDPTLDATYSVSPIPEQPERRVEIGDDAGRRGPGRRDEIDRVRAVVVVARGRGPQPAVGIERERRDMAEPGRVGRRHETGRTLEPGADVGERRGRRPAPRRRRRHRRRRPGRAGGCRRFASLVRHPGGPPKRTAGADVGTYVAGVAAGFGVSGCPTSCRTIRPSRCAPMFGQLALLPPAGWFGRVDGVVVPGVVVLGADEAPGSGLAAETTAAAPPTRSSAESAAVSTVRLSPEPFVCGAAGSGGASRRRLDRRQGSRQCRLVMPFQCDLLGSFGLGGCRLVVVASVHGHLRARGRGRRCGWRAGVPGVPTSNRSSRGVLRGT